MIAAVHYSLVAAGVANRPQRRSHQPTAEARPRTPARFEVKVLPRDAGARCTKLRCYAGQREASSLPWAGVRPAAPVERRTPSDRDHHCRVLPHAARRDLT